MEYLTSSFYGVVQKSVFQIGNGDSLVAYWVKFLCVKGFIAFRGSRAGYSET